MPKWFTPRSRKTALKLAAALGCFVLIFAIYLLLTYRSLPSVEAISERRVKQSTKIYDREGKILLYEISGGEKRTVVPLGEIPKFLRDATIAIEDEKFYETPGVDVAAIIRAALVNLRHGRILQGGSSITQQLAKNAFLSSERTYGRKLKEFLLALRLNRRYAKDQILALYLNEIPYGPTAYGVEAASRTYFGKSAKELNVAESALLAALPKAPSYYSPWGSHLKELLARQQFILKKMHRLGVIDEEQLAAALEYGLSFQPQGEGIAAPHFVIAVQDHLVKKYGEDLVRTGGLTVKTTLDWELQQFAETAVREGADRNFELYRGKNASLVALDPKTGQVLTMVGSRDYFDTQNEGNFNVATQGLRQPGSALKPFVYLTAFAKGYGPETAIFDVPTEFAAVNPSCPPIPDFKNDDPRCFHPEDFDSRLRGPVSFRQALGQSINIPAVKVLYLVGLRDALKTLNDFGVSTLTNPNRYGLSLVLGGGEVKLIELASAYAVLAADGVRRPWTLVLEVKDSNGQVLESHTERGEQIFDPQYVRMTTDILTDVETRSGLFGSSLTLTTFPGHEVALKTGTSNDYRDAWAFGYTPSLVAGVWAGNNDNSPMQKSGSSILAAVPIWNKFMTKALTDRPAEAFAKPQPTTPQKPVLRGDYLAEGLHSILYSVDRNNPEGPPPQDPSRDSQFANWEAGIRRWAEENQPSLLTQFSTLGTLGQSQGQAPEIAIEQPRPGAFIENRVLLQAALISPSPITQVRVLFNGEVVERFNGPFPQNYNFAWSFTPKNASQQNLLEVEATNQDNRTGRSSTIVYR